LDRPLRKSTFNVLRGFARKKSKTSCIKKLNLINNKIKAYSGDLKQDKTKYLKNQANRIIKNP